MLNQVALMGRLTRDPELKYTSTNKPVTSFRLAVDRDYKGDNAVDFITCVAWDKTAEMVSRYYRKGERMVVNGRIQTRNWVDSDGSNRSATEVVVDRAYFVEPKLRSDIAHSPEPSGKIADIGDEDGKLPF